MPAPLELDIAAHLARVRRRGMAFRPGVQVLDVGPGWLMHTPGASLAEHASSSPHRLHWMSPDRDIHPADLDHAANISRSLGVNQLYVWLAPWAFTPALHAAFTQRGASTVPWVEYIGLSRPATSPPPPATPTSLTVRLVSSDEAESVLRCVSPWYSESGAATALNMLRAGHASLHAAFDGPTPVAIGLLALDDAWAYLFAAGTDPQHRRRGAQSVLIDARVAHAAASGAAHCACETNTAVATSLANLRRRGFVDTIRWRVLKWDLPA